MGFGINQVVLSGNLTRDPELRSTAGGTSLCKFSIAVNERIKRDGDWQDRPNYFRVTMWGGVGEWVANKLHKGDSVVVQGRLRWDSWEKDGQKRESVEVVGENIVTPPSGGPRSSNGGGQQRETPVGEPDFVAGGAAMPGADDDIPF